MGSNGLPRAMTQLPTADCKLASPPPPPRSPESHSDADARLQAKMRGAEQRLSSNGDMLGGIVAGVVIGSMLD